MVQKLDKITGWYGVGSVFHNGKLLYYAPDYVEFNLPIGTFYFEGDFTQLDKPLVYIIPDLPKYEKRIKMKKIDISVVDNPNKASIDVLTGKVYFDKVIKDDWETAKKVFILGHEIGHNYYKTELFCDLFSAKKMLENGFNPSQCFYSSFYCLSNGNIGVDRKQQLLNFLEKVKIKE